MTCKRPLLWLILVTAFAGMTCAPHGELPRKSTEPSTAERTAAEASPPVLPASLKGRIDAALEHVRRRPLLMTHAFWTVFHGILGMGPETALYDPRTNKNVNAIEHICKGLPIEGLEFLPMAEGVDVRTVPGTGTYQGHQDQFIAEMAQWGMPLERKFVVGGKDYTFADFVRYSKLRARVTANQELSWAILIIGQYYGTDVRWTNKDGEPLTFEDVVRYEVNQPIDNAACGGTHRLFGLTWVYHLHRANGGQKVGVWRDVADKIDEY